MRRDRRSEKTGNHERFHVAEAAGKGGLADRRCAAALRAWAKKHEADRCHLDRLVSRTMKAVRVRAARTRRARAS